MGLLAGRGAASAIRLADVLNPRALRARAVLANAILEAPDMVVRVCLVRSGADVGWWREDAGSLTRRVFWVFATTRGCVGWSWRRLNWPHLIGRSAEFSGVLAGCCYGCQRTPSSSIAC